MYPDLKLFIDGKWRKSDTDIPVINPATEESIGRLPCASKNDLDDALEAAVKGFEIWRRTSPRERANTILRAASLMRERQDDIAQSITQEHGKPLKQSKLEVIRGAEFFEWDAGEAMRTYGRVIPAAPGHKYSVHHQPIGVVAAFSPWNFPMSQPARKIAGALASGCSIILKAAEETPAGAIHIAKAFEDAGLPYGVLNLVFGRPSEISNYLIPKEPIRLVAFTGSTSVGRELSTLASQNMTRSLMELGGHAPVIICEDTDVTKSAILSANRKIRNSGQVCTSPTRFFVHEKIFDDYSKAFVKYINSIVVGNGLDPDVDMGPTANSRRISSLSGLVEDAINNGAIVATGGNKIDIKGYFFQPTVLLNVPKNSRIMSEEPFGPIAVINSVKSLDDAIEKANSVPYGLAGYAFTNRADYIDQLIDRVEVGNLSINTLEASMPETPFGGIKSSGHGREGGLEGLQNYMSIKNVWYSSKIS